MKYLFRFILGMFFLSSLFSCGGTGPVEGKADLSAFQNDEGLYVFQVKGVSFSLMPVVGGTFTMGETFDQGLKHNPDIHQVILDGYAIGTTEVTQELWYAVMGTHPGPQLVPSAPVSRVTWDDAQKFVHKLGKKTGVAFRLPTESEWEFAARKHPEFCEGVWEWCSDYYQESFKDALYINPEGPKTGDTRVLKGGSEIEKPQLPSARKPMASYAKASDAGFRLAVSLDEPCDQEILDVLVRNRVPRDPVEDLKVRTFTVNGVSFRMMPVEGGTFRMGATPEHERAAADNEYPVHEVTLDNYMMGEFEVTGALWKAVMGSLPAVMAADNKPVGNITWFDAQLFIRRLNELTGCKFRLPTEAEWEYAARGGKKTHGYPLAGASNSNQVAVHSTDDLRTRPVGTLLPNELGLYDMSGNAWEWCQDRLGAYPSTPQTNPTGPDYDVQNPEQRIMRGGSAAAKWDKCRTAKRSANNACRFKSTIGFRLAL